MHRSDFENRLEKCRRALALLHAGRAVTARYANAVIGMHQARVDDFEWSRGDRRLTPGGHVWRPRFRWTLAAVEELLAYRQLSEQVAAERKADGRGY